ncbi:MAG: RnfH family protein [Gammaproteobacteria bacterium]|nr:RnfH family protein [Gammaproteobacteria bacterium]
MSLDIEVVYALPDHQEVISIRCKKGTTIKQAVIQSQMMDRYPEIHLAKVEFGVYGLKQSLDYELSNLDRVEIYRPLLLTPTEARRLRAKSKMA